MHASHWEHLARILCRRGIEIDAAELAALPHDVELGERVLARIAAAPRDAPTEQ
jgi:hypothetical protein